MQMRAAPARSGAFAGRRSAFNAGAPVMHKRSSAGPVARRNLTVNAKVRIPAPHWCRSGPGIDVYERDPCACRP
jgi:hypothetical protein